jgi:adenosylcobinamide-phosphate synthase
MLTGLSVPHVALMVLAGVILDLLLGELPRWHPLAGFGRWADVVERCLNRGRHRFWRGLLAWMLAVLPLAALAYWVAGNARIGFAAHVVLLYFCIGLRSLRDHNLPISQALRQEDLALARLLTSRVVSRDTRQAGASDLAKASTESLLENGNDAVFGTLFWFALAGGPGALLFRLANTLDAMWGYRTPRFLDYGCAAARIDDALNWVPARLTALSYVVLAATLADKRRAWRCWRRQAPAWASPNAGPVMASGAGALGLALGGAAVYDGVTEQRPVLGTGRPAQGEDIVRAWRLVAAATALWVAIMALIGALSFFTGGMHA